MMDRWTWFITGASSGLGRALTEAVLATGDRVVAGARRTTMLDDLIGRHRDQLLVTPLDVTDGDAIDRAVSAAMTAFHTVEVVVNNAGYGLVGGIEEMTDEQVRRQIETNLLGPIRVTKAFLPYLRRQGFGRFIQVSSSGGQRTAPSLGVYHATKWALEAFSEALSAETATFGIRVTIAEPGSFRTGWRQAADHTEPIAAYADTAVGVARREFGNYVAPGDPARMAQVLIDAVRSDSPPRRLVLGSDSYKMIHAALITRLAEVEAQKQDASRTDATDTPGT